VFTGIELNGAIIKQDAEETRRLYGKAIPFRSILAGKITPPVGTEGFLSAVQRYAQPSRVKSTGAALQSTSVSEEHPIGNLVGFDKGPRNHSLESMSTGSD
jgi:hypothetical protein